MITSLLNTPISTNEISSVNCYDREKKTESEKDIRTCNFVQRLTTMPLTLFPTIECSVSKVMNEDYRPVAATSLRKKI